MAIALYKIEGKILKKEIIPISSQKYFKDIWLKFCVELNLKWVPLFESGAEFTQDDIPFILKELNDLFSFCKLHYTNQSEPIIERLIVLLKKIAEFKTSQITSFYIG